ncbi:MAG: hypothetical protein QM817_31870 [Archangium sp.]
MKTRGLFAVLSALAWSACGPTPTPPSDAGVDAGVVDAGTDGGSMDFDAGVWDGGLLQLNDVSVLFPLASSATELSTSSLKPTAIGSRGMLFPQATYDAVGHISGSSGNPPPGGIGEALYPDLHIVAVRVDPCFAELNPDPHSTTCENQLRLIIQEVKATGGTGNGFDSAMHVFYRLNRAEVLAFARGVAMLREANAPGQRLGKLAPHPVMVTQGLGGAMASGVRALILRYAGVQNLMRVTKLSASTAGFGWDFSGFDIAPNGTLTAMVIPSLAMNATSQSLFSGFSITSPEAFFSPSTTSADDFTRLSSSMSAGMLTMQERATAFDALIRVNHPARNSPNTIDCASCHFATPTSVLIAKAKYSLDEATTAGVFTVTGPAVLPTELVPTFQTTGGFNVHAFSYFDAEPGINQRVVNESAAVVEFLNSP